MARVVLAQIFTYVTVFIFHDNSPLSYWNPVPIHDSYQTICTLAIHDVIASDHRNYRYTIASDHRNYRYTIASDHQNYRYTIASDHQTTDTR